MTPPVLPPRIEGKLNLILCPTGSVASLKTPSWISLLKPYFQLILLPTPTALRFFNIDEVDVQVLNDSDEWQSWKGRGDGVLHIELRKWADAILIAPCSAHFLSCMAGGLCDSLALEVLRAWDFSKPVMIAPAMNTNMFTHPITDEHLDKVRGWGIHVFGPVEKMLVCGDSGIGGMIEVGDLVDAVCEVMKGRRVQIG